ncbi:MAG: hypothetical protein M9947_04965 [Thermomicrobiales bacterium]|nr:hypothetical protein [Thermomicrobiales bacterium]
MPDLFLELRNQDDTSGQSLPPLAEEEALRLLETAEFTAAKLIPWGSNYSFAVALADSSGVEQLAIYKPRAGEAPLHDFRGGTLFRREVAAYRLSKRLGWGIVPPTIIRQGPHGTGSLQLYIQPAPDAGDPHELWGDLSLENERFVLFDHIANNADRKLSHCLLDASGKRWGIDHGLTFNEVPKLRTVMWQFAGMPITESLRRDLGPLLEQREACAEDFKALLTHDEIDAFFARVDALHRSGCYPDLDPYRNIPYGWW